MHKVGVAYSIPAIPEPQVWRLRSNAASCNGVISARFFAPHCPRVGDIYIFYALSMHPLFFLCTRA